MESDRNTNRRAAGLAGLWVLGVAITLSAPPSASADLYLLRHPDGRIHLTNRSRPKGFRVLHRIREFRGSSGMGLGSSLRNDPTTWDSLVARETRGRGIDPQLVRAVIRAESAFDPNARSPKGAMGLMQLMPGTARIYGVKNAYNPDENVRAGVRHLSYLLKRYDGALDLALAAYNAGTRPVDRVRGIPNYPETREYVRRVRQYFDGYRNIQARIARPIDPVGLGQRVLPWGAPTIPF